MDKYDLIISKISKIKNEFSDYIVNELEKRGIEGLMVSHGNILAALYENGGRMTMKEISKRIGRSKSTVTQLVEGLIKAGYVIKETDLEDRRYSHIVLTQKGIKIKKDFNDISEKLVDIFFRGFSDAEADVLLSFLEHIESNFK